MAWFFVLLFLDTQVNFLTVNSHLFRGVDTNTHLISFDAEHGHGDFAITNNQAFCAPTSQNQHTFLLTHFIQGQQSAKKRHSTYNRNDRSPTCLSIDQREQKNRVLGRAIQKRRRARSDRALRETLYSPWRAGASSSKAVCSARTASSRYFSSITTETLISDVEIIWMLMLSLARASNMRLATPAWERMPTPTIDTLAILVSPTTSRAPIPLAVFCRIRSAASYSLR